MEVALTPELEELIHEEVESGRYPSPGEVIRDALRHLKQNKPQESELWESRSAAEHAAAQGVKPVQSLDEVCGGWPEDELDDGFEIAVRQWRDAELRHEE